MGMNKLVVAAGIACALVASPAMAQFNQSNSDLIVEAIKEGSLGSVQSLVLKDPKVLNQRSYDGDLPIVLAAQSRSASLLDFLLANKADPNALDGKGQLAIVAAAARGWSEGVGNLVGAGANINGRNKQGETAIIIAVQTRNVRLLKDMLANGADPDIADRVAGFSARDYAKRENRVPELLRIIEAAKPAAR